MNKNYTLVTFFLIVVVLIGVSFLTYQNLNNYTDEVSQIRHSNKVLRSLEMILSSLKDAESGHRGYQLTHDSTFLVPYAMAIVEIPVLAKKLDSLVSDNPEQLKRMDSLKVMINVQLLLIPQILANTNRSSLYMDTYEKSLLFRGKHNMDAIRLQTKKIVAVEQLIFNDRLKKETDFRGIAPVSILIYTLLAIGGAAILFFRALEALRKREEAKEALALSLSSLKSEVAVREFTQTLLKNVLDNSPNGILAYASIRNSANEIIDFKCLLANAASLNEAQKNESEVVGKNLLEVFPSTKQQLFDIFKEVVTVGKPISVDNYSQVGFIQWYSITVIKLDDGFVVTYTNITEQREKIILVKERELVLKEAEVLANMGSWKWTAHTDEMIWSDGLSRILGNIEAGKRSWNTFVECAHPDDKEMLLNFITNAKNKLEEFRMEYRCIINNTIRNFYIMVTTETEIEKGNILGVVVDITDLRQKEQELNLINNDLRRSNEDLEQFAYVASHDLQEPLRKIRAFGDLLVVKYSNQIENIGADYIQRMQSAAARMQVLIYDLLAFSRVSQKSFHTQQVNLNTIAAEVVDDLEHQILHENATIQVGELPSLKGDSIQLKRLLQNLISNAIKFHKKNEPSRVNIQAVQFTLADQQKYFPSAPSDTKYISFMVEDNGIGFDPQYTEQIFNIFQRLHGRMDFEGTGIGLAICKKIINNHRGIIVAEGLENIGSKFIVTLPLT